MPEKSKKGWNVLCSLLHLFFFLLIERDLVQQNDISFFIGTELFVRHVVLHTKASFNNMKLFWCQYGS